jgi:uncharacterized protein YjbI with pentapeptide repeats
MADRAMLSRWRARRVAARSGRYAPRLWPVPVVLVLALVAAGAAGYGIYVVLPHRAGPKATVLEVVRAALGVAAFFGAALAGVYAYRKQRLAEGDARRADAEQLATRYSTAAEQLGHEKAAVRLAGVYAMARLADDWPEQRQTCIDVLCAYLRMPYEPDPDAMKHREGEQEVRHTAVRVIAEHFRDPKAPASWCGRNLDFTGAVLDGGDFTGAVFSAGRVSFEGTAFPGGRVSFDGAEFSRGRVSFDWAEVSVGRLTFDRAAFSGSEVSFVRVHVTGEQITWAGRHAGGGISFYGAEFSGSEVSFDNAAFFDDWVSFRGARFSGGTVSYSGVSFHGTKAYRIDDRVSFRGAEFSGGTVSFESVRDWTRPPRFDFTEPPSGVLLPSRPPDGPASTR